MARHAEGEPLREAMLAVVDEVMALMHERGITQPLRFAATLSDGQRLHAFRIASDERPPTLYLRHCSGGTIIASEPLCDEETGWLPLPAGAVLTVDADGVHQTRHASPALALS